MKNHNRQKELTLPGEVVDICGFDPGEALSCRVEKDLLVAAPASMTALQTVRAIDALTCLAAEFLGKLKDACGPCEGCPDGCPYEGVYGPEAELSEDIRAEMGIPEGNKLHVEVRDGVAHVTDGGQRHDITDVPPAVRRMLEDIGACAGSLDELMMLDGEVVHHG